MLLALAATPPAGAHELRPVIATLELGPGGSFALQLSLNLEAAIAGIGPSHEDTTDSPNAPDYDRLHALPPAALGQVFEGFAPTLLDRIGLAFDGTAAALEVEGAEIPEAEATLPRISEIRLAGRRPPGADTVTWQIDPLLGDSVLRLRAPGGDEILAATFVRAGSSTGPLVLEGAEPPGRLEVFADYFRLGYVHIVPKGLDHILFVVGLFLLSIRLSALLWQITAFTVAHSVTLALGMLGLVQVSPAIVEPLIAASIAWVAVENIVTTRMHPWRPLVVFCFGLLHGLGFAGVLREIGLTGGDFLTGLVAFNLGVEAGQLSVIALCFLAVGWAMGRRLYRPVVVVPGSVAIALVAVFWVVDRTGVAEGLM